MKLVACILVLLSCACFGQVSATIPSAADAIETEGLSNGRRWNRLTKLERLIYIIAYHDGVVAGIFATSEATQKEKIAYVHEMYPSTLEYAELGMAIDKFYESPENLLISIPTALRLIIMKTAGAEPSVLDPLIAKARREALDSLKPSQRN